MACCSPLLAAARAWSSVLELLGGCEQRRKVRTALADRLTRIELTARCCGWRASVNRRSEHETAYGVQVEAQLLTQQLVSRMTRPSG